MKKLLVLSIVSAMAASASAGLYITAGAEGAGTDPGSWGVDLIPGFTTWIGIYAEDMPGFGYFQAFILIADDPCSQAYGEWTGVNNVYIPPAIPGAYNEYYGYAPGYGDLWFLVNAAPGPIGSDGLHADFEFQGVCPGSETIIELWDGGLHEVVDTLTIQQFNWWPEITVDPPEFSFTVLEGTGNSQSQVLRISNTGDDGFLHWELTETCGWLQADPNSGVVWWRQYTDVDLSVDVSGLLPGIYDCNVIISDTLFCNPPQKIVPIELQVLARPCDFDEDGGVDCDDLRILALAFMSKSGDDNWNPDCDISDPNDEVIDGQDFGVFSMYWEGCGDPPP